MFLYRDLLGMELGHFDAVRARPPVRVPVVMTVDEVRQRRDLQHRRRLLGRRWVEHSANGIFLRKFMRKSTHTPLHKIITKYCAVITLTIKGSYGKNLPT